MKNIIYLICFLFILSFSGCGKNNPTIILSNIDEQVDIQIPFEIDPGKLKVNEKNLIARSLTNQNHLFILQKTPSLFSSENETGKQVYCALLPTEIQNGRFEVYPIEKETSFSFSENDQGKLTIVEDELPVLTYNFGMQLKPEVHERYKRSTYIHPIYDLKGNELTDDFPSDHYHHRGLSWMWPKVFINGKRYDLWHIYGSQGELDGIHQVFEDWLIKETGPVCTTLGVKNRWELDDQQKVMDEWVYVRVFKTGQLGRTIDLSLTWKAVEHIQIIGQTQKGYGGLNFRFAPRQETTITTPTGVEEKDSDLKEIPWADQSAKFAGNNYFSGASIFQQQNNAGFPAGWCLRHYGFLGVAWPGLEAVTVDPGESITLRFRLWIHQGNAEEGKVKKAYDIFLNPPQLVME